MDGGPASRAPRRPAEGPPRRRVSVHAGRDVRDRARSHRPRRADGHDARPAGRVRDVLELRRGRPPLGAGALRHDGGAAQARRAVRPDRPRPPPRPPPVRDRRPLRPRADPGRDLQAAPRLWPRGRRRARAREWLGGGVRRRRRAACDGRPGGRGGHRRQAAQAGQERRLRPSGGGARLRQPRADLPHGRAAPAHARGDRRAPPAAAAQPARASAHRLAARPLAGARGRGARAARHALPDRGPGRGRGPARGPRPARGGASAAQRRLRARRRRHGGQLLRPRHGRGLRIRGADLVPRRPRRPADPRVPAAPRRRCPPRRSPSSAPRRCTSCSWAGAAGSRTRHHPRSEKAMPAGDGTQDPDRREPDRVDAGAAR